MLISLLLFLEHLSFHRNLLYVMVNQNLGIFSYGLIISKMISLTRIVEKITLIIEKIQEQLKFLLQVMELEI